MALAVNQRLGRYEILAPLGVGGMGEVYRARDVRLGRDVAVKILKEASASKPGRLSRFEREARAVAALNHPNILTVHDVGVEDGAPYLVTELLEGQTLRAALARGGLSAPKAVEIGVQVALGLSAAHAKGILHRDLKPENVFLTDDGRVKILDFGLAKLRDDGDVGSEASTDAALSQAGTLLGTLGYMAPEQLQGRTLDVRADVFALGVVLHEMLSGRAPFRRDTAAATLAAILGEDPPRLSLTGRAVSATLEALVWRCLEKRPEDRFHSAHDLALALRTLSGEAASLARWGAEERESCPYPGLRPFLESDVAHFFGREAEIQALWERLRAHRLLAVIGASGAGKTSFVRAGVIPARPVGWGALVVTPGRSPLASLARALAPELAGDPEALRELVACEDAGVLVGLVARWRQRQPDALVVVDQFEELFTLNGPEVQAEFTRLLGRLAAEAGSHVLLSLRDDFLMRCHEHAALGPVFTELTPLGPPRVEGLRRALLEPARKEGYRFEDEALVEEMLGAVEGERGALPLLAFAVSRLWEKRDRERKLLTREAYAAIGGVSGALAQHAEATLERIGRERQGVVREIFRNLVTAQGTRAVIDREELLSAFEERAAADLALRELIDARLLTSYEVEGREGESSRQRVEIVHESLLRAWPRLVRWQAQDEEGALLRDQLRQAAHLWQEKGRPDDLLWTGASYREYGVWRERYPGKLTALEEDFARAMVARATQQRRLRRAAIAAVIVGLTAAAVAIGVSRQQAVRQARRAEASKLLAMAQLRLSRDPTEALALTTASIEVSDAREAREFAVDVLSEAPPALELEAGVMLRAPVFSPSGRWLAVAGWTDEVRVWSADGAGPVMLKGHEISPRGGNRAAWTASDLLVTGFAGAARFVHIWSLPHGQRLRTVDFGAPTWWQVGVDALFAETEEASSVPGRPRYRLRTWSLPHGEPKELGRVDWGMLGATTGAFSPQGTGWLYTRGPEFRFVPLPVSSESPDRLLASSRSDVALGGFLERRGTSVTLESYARHPGSVHTWSALGEIQLWSLSPEPALERTLTRPGVSARDLSPEAGGRWLASVSTSQQARLWDADAWQEARPLALRRDGSWYAAGLDVSHQGDWCVAGTRGMSHLTLWPLKQPRPVIVDDYTQATRPVAFSPDGLWLATSWADGNLRLWALPGGRNPEVRLLPVPEPTLWRELVFDPRERYVFAAGHRGRAYVVPLDGTPPRRLWGFSDDTMLESAAVSPSGRLVATAFGFGTGEKVLRIWDLETRAVRTLELPNVQQTANGGTLTSTGYENGVWRVEFADESTLFTVGHGGIRRWDLSSGGQQLLVATGTGISMRASAVNISRGIVATMSLPIGDWTACRQVELYDLKSRPTRSLPQFGECTFSLALDHSGTVAAAGGVDGTVRVGRLEARAPQRLLGHTSGRVDRVAISPDLKWVASTGEDNTLRLWPMPDLDKPPLHTLPHDELIAKLKSLTNFRAVRDPAAPNGWKIEIGPFPGWKDVPTW